MLSLNRCSVKTAARNDCSRRKAYRGTLIGSRIGPYQVQSLIGSGGMGDVYRATDGKLGRDVAIKVLPSAFVGDTGRIARIEREARLLATLNHPHIAAIYGLEDATGSPALVMELVEGKTLAQRLANGAIPVGESLALAVQIAQALEAAHVCGIVHRDLKPSNIKISQEGTVKVLDFGLAKMSPPQTAQRSASELTPERVVLGTPAYMSPEQARGQAIDKRADNWAFGAVLFEMLTGTSAFGAGTVADTLAQILERDPDWQRLPPDTSAGLRRVLRLCLTKEPQDRLHDIADARIDLAGIAASRESEPRQSRPTQPRLLVWSAAALVLATTLGLAVHQFLVPSPESHPIFASVMSPEGWHINPGFPAMRMSMSPDGRQLAFVAAGDGGRRRLWIRRLDLPQAEMLEGTDNALSPFWSPDSRSVGFFSDGKLKVVSGSGGPIQAVCDAVEGSGGTWNQNGVIVFGARRGPRQGLFRVSMGSADKPIQITQPLEGNHQHPFFLPDGRHFLFRASTGGSEDAGAFLGRPTAGTIEHASIFIGSLDDKETRPVATGTSQAVYAQSHLLFVQDRTLMAQPFDASTLKATGKPRAILKDVATGGAGVSDFSASQTGVIAYRNGVSPSRSRLIWADRTGREVAALGDASFYGDLELSPDGNHAAIGAFLGGQDRRDIVLFDLVRMVQPRFTFDPADDAMAIWSKDASYIVFNSRRQGAMDLYIKATSGAIGAERLLLADGLNKYPFSWSPDGRFVLYGVGATGRRTNQDLFYVAVDGNSAPVPFAQSDFDEYAGRFSPDGKWVAYQSGESGESNEIWIAPFPGPGPRTRVSKEGGRAPRWRQDGRELFFLDSKNRLVAATISMIGSRSMVQGLVPLFDSRTRSGISAGVRYPYDVSRDGQRFLLNTVIDSPASSAAIGIVFPWSAALTEGR